LRVVEKRVVDLQRESNSGPYLIHCARKRGAQRDQEGERWRKGRKEIGVEPKGSCSHVPFSPISEMDDWADACRWVDACTRG
jgi:hypothetical protein